MFVRRIDSWCWPIGWVSGFYGKPMPSSLKRGDNMQNNLIVQAAPHIHSVDSTARLMGLVLVALLPASIASIVLFGFRALVLILCCIIACVGFEYLSCRIMKRPNPIRDLSAAVTGLLLALNLPVTMPIPQAILGCFFCYCYCKATIWRYWAEFL